MQFYYVSKQHFVYIIIIEAFLCRRKGMTQITRKEFQISSFVKHTQNNFEKNNIDT